MSFGKLFGRFGMFSLNGQTALVTGASRGIGLSVAQTLAGLGATVVLNSQDGDALDLLIQEGRVAGFNFHSKVFDAGVPEQAISAVDEITAEIGSIDIIFCNAGIQHRDGRRGPVGGSCGDCGYSNSKSGDGRCNKVFH